MEGQGSTINSYGYSPHPLSKYLEWVESILKASNIDKPIIISISASTPEDLTKMVMAIQELRKRLNDSDRNRPSRIAVEFNTSCPNISGSSPSGSAPLVAEVWTYHYLTGAVLSCRTEGRVRYRRGTGGQVNARRKFNTVSI